MKSCRFLALGALVGLTALGYSDRALAEWQARYDHLSSVVRHKDFKAFQAFLAPDYQWVLPDGSHKDRKASVAAFAPMFQVKKISGGEKLLKVVLKGDRADVYFDARWALVMPDGKTVRSEERGVDTWRKIHGRWMALKTVDFPEKR